MIEFAYANTAAQQPNALIGIVPWIAIFALMYFMMIRPQQKREKARQAMINELKKGEQVILTTGIYGKVVQAEERYFVIEIAKGVNIKIDRNAIAAKVDANGEVVETPTEAPKETPKEDKESKSE